jgi:3-dehydroquinate synthase
MVWVNLGSRSYEVAVVAHGRPTLAEFVAGRLPGRTSVIVTDSHLEADAQTLASGLRQAGLSVSLEVIQPGEGAKSIATAELLWSRLAARNADRATAIIAVGGGVISDIAGFVAATYARGLPWLVVPTSLLAMVDSAIGGKVGINLPEGKNLVGAIHQPHGVWIDLALLASLPDRELRSGLAEVVKYGAVMDAEFFAWLEEYACAILRRDTAAMRYVVEKCCELKARIVAEDERELSGLRLVLNYGHTFAHAFETAGGYTGSHGEAVAIGMVCASRLAERQGWISSETTQRVVALLTKFGLPITPPLGSVDDWLVIMRRDKKAMGGRMRFVLPREIGRVEIVDAIPDAEVVAVLTTPN